MKCDVTETLDATGVLVMGIGNTLRADDGVGAVAVHALEKELSARGAVCLTTHQLLPEHCAAVHEASLAVFIDASCQHPAGEVHWEYLDAETCNLGTLGHHMTPGQLLGWTQQLYGHVPRAVTVTIGADSFALGNSLSPLVTHAVNEAVSLTLQNVATWQNPQPAETADPENPTLSRWRWRVRGQVQGVGFRPFVHRIANSAGVTGSVLNDGAGVWIEVQGTSRPLNQFERMFHADQPPLAQVKALSRERIPIAKSESTFRVLDSIASPHASADVAIDTAACPSCLLEMRNVQDRRFTHALVNCTHCGPRFSIIRNVPYDRANTTMADFSLCDQCRREYENPTDRRFHAQPTCCPQCGPTLTFLDVSPPPSSSGHPVGQEAIDAAVAQILAGQIVALKGLGGFHLAVRADNHVAVSRLRLRKHRDQKPFALMVPDLAAAHQLVRLSHPAVRELTSPRAPIVLAPRQDSGLIAPAVAPGNHRLGVMLAYTPLHHLLWDALRKRLPTLPALVMTSGNQTDEPLVIDNAEALSRLGPLADGLLLHDRPIQRCVDDSVLLDRGQEKTPLPIRRSRGFVPAPLPLAGTSTEIAGLCVGAELKDTVAVLRQGEVILSQHLGDLSNAVAFTHFQQAIDDLLRLFSVTPQFVAHDLHPAYLSTTFAVQLAARWQVPLIGVQHHQAHAAAVLTESGAFSPAAPPALALVCDGSGFGADGTIWGGEVFLVRHARFQRVARLKPLRLPGGDAAAKHPDRAALSLLYAAYGEAFLDLPITHLLFPDSAELASLAAMISRGFRCPWSSSTGRLFDGAAAILGLCAVNSYEGQAAQTLEAAASADVSGHSPFPPSWSIQESSTGLIELSFAPLFKALVEGRQQGVSTTLLARAFHDQLALGFSELVHRLAITHQVSIVGLSGGVFCNTLLTDALSHILQAHKLQVLTHQLVPPNDGGIAYGQAAIAARIFSERHKAHA